MNRLKTTSQDLVVPYSPDILHQPKVVVEKLRKMVWVSGDLENLTVVIHFMASLDV